MSCQIMQGLIPGRSLFIRKRTFTALTAALAAAAALPAGAQLEEIVVTAERRETSLQDTPISVLAFTGAELELKGVETLEDLAVNSPNLDIKGSRGTGNVSPTYMIRGISGGGGATGERGVGFYLDGVFVPRQTGPYMQILDVDRIEVLRGPQGTLFGRNSLGGAIRVFTRRPSQEQEGYLSVTGGNFDRYNFNGMLNLPVSDSFALRGQAAYLHQDGYVTRGPQELGSSEDIILRLQADWEPRADLSVGFGVMYLDSESDGNPQDMEFFDMAPVDPIDGVSSVIAFEGGYADWMSDFLESSGQPRLSNNDPRLLLDDFTMPDFCFLDDPDPDWDALCLQVNENSYLQLDATVGWDINETTSLTSISGYTDFSSSGITDWQLLGMESRPSASESWTFYQELQLNTELFDGRVDLVSGVNFFHETAKDPRTHLFQATGTSVFGGFPFWSNPATQRVPNGNGWSGGTVTSDLETRQKSDSFGWFASGTWHVMERLNLTAGLRIAHDIKDIRATEYASSNFMPECTSPVIDYTTPAGTACNARAGSTTIDGDDNWTRIDWRGTIDVQLTDDAMIYGTASKAYRAGSYSLAIEDTIAGAAQSEFITPIPPEKVVNFEVGARTDWADNRFRFNVTAFDMKYSNRQNPTAVVDANAPVGFVIQLVNQGNVKFQGIEVDGEWLVTDTLVLDASAGWVDSDVVDVCTNNGMFLFPAPARESYNVGGRLDLPFEVLRGRLTVAMNYAYTGKQHTHPGGVDPGVDCGPNQGPAGAWPPTATWFLDSRYELPGYGLLSARLNYASSDERWEASIFANNLTDETYGNFASRFGGGYWEGGPPAPVGFKAPLRSALGVTRGRPLEWGVTLKYNFF